MAQDPEREVVHIKLPRSIVRAVDHMAVDHDLYRQNMIEKLLTFALANKEQMEGSQVGTNQTIQVGGA